MTAAVDRFDSVDWAACSESLWQRGYAQLPPLLTPEDCGAIARLYPDDSLFRSKIVMERFRFGRGEYKYFAYPLPPLVQELRERAYPHFAEIANAWNEALGETDRFPASLDRLLKECRKAGQKKPTPLLLRYGKDDYNCMHQDIYGAIAFPLQMAVFLSRPGEEFAGGEFVLAEQQPRAQTKIEVLLPQQGEAVIFTTRYRPAHGTRGWYRVSMRHGVSRVRSGQRYTLGIIFHDAQ